MSNYEVSIVTPFHNIELDIFKNGLASMKSQSLGFEKIEWIIVLHNCKEEYITGVQEMVKDYENIKTYILNNDVHSASSPRNYGMKVATAPYIGFLDGDDSFTTSCLEVVLSHMRKSGAQVTWFRREYELESENSIPVTEIVLWDQTRDEIIIEKDLNWDDEKIFSAVWGLVTSRMYDLQFLRDNHIEYDESVKLGEDYLFNFEVYGRAKKLCYLPQTIGYHYYINSGSIIQKSEKTEAELIHMAEGLKKIYECGLKYGFYMDATIGGVTFVLVRFMMGTSSLTLEGRKRIKEIVGPYVEMMKTLKPSKIYSEKAAYDRSTFLKDYILNPEKWANGDNDAFISDTHEGTRLPVDQQILNDILEANANTDMGKRYDFRSINTLSGFQAKVPVTDYDFYEPLIALNTRIGESGIFVSEPITNYVYYNGPYGNKKLLPVTNSHIKDYVKLLEKVVSKNITFALYESVSNPFKFNDSSLAASIYGAMNLEFYKQQMSGQIKADSKFVVPFYLTSITEMNENKYMKFLFALKEDKLTQIFAPSMRSLLYFIDFIEKNIEDLIHDIENGTIHNVERLPKEQQKALLGMMKADPQRAEYLRQIDFHNLSFMQIWPKLQKIYATKSGDYEICYSSVRKMAEGVEIVNTPIIMPEMIMGTPYDDSNLFVLNLENCFYEFRRLLKNGEYEDKLVFYRDLIAGERYQVYVTNKSGLYRYATKVIIKIHHCEEDKVVFEIDSSTNLCATYKDVSISIDDINRSMVALDKLSSINIFEYVCFERDNSLNFYLELRKTDVDQLDLEEIEHTMDGILSDIVPGYQAAREEGCINHPVIHIVEQETSLLYVELKARKNDVIVDSIPSPHFVTEEKDIKFFNQFIIK